MSAKRKGRTAAWLIYPAWVLVTTTAIAAEDSARGDPFSPTTLKDWVSVISTLITMALAIWGIWSGLRSARNAIQEKRKEHRQKQLAAARDMMKEIFLDPLARSAMRMMDWSGRTFTHEGQTYVVHWRDLKPALVVHEQGVGFTKQQEFIRDCFEAFFDHMLVLEHFLEQDYLHEADIAVPLEYYARRVMLFPETYDGFLREYGYREARALMKRLADGAK
ncbi:hypothetical protein QMA79_19010 [Pseudomonas aeruginosa]|uniref:hypothetical protein n=1 Tax=Pseudomonas aeruginosa TaxID=287 RepID=UPI0024AD260C|nr:hypothetical protein [Pseudomonas aeruginosa]MDI6671907.1 hypothetical protein [Pseudomonas aeruginosa]HCJ7406214.1 hypothetical protein [Pseudomonas aeruginosa]